MELCSLICGIFLKCWKIVILCFGELSAESFYFNEDCSFRFVLIFIFLFFCLMFYIFFLVFKMQVCKKVLGQKILIFFLLKGFALFIQFCWYFRNGRCCFNNSWCFHNFYNVCINSNTWIWCIVRQFRCFGTCSCFLCVALFFN